MIQGKTLISAHSWVFKSYSDPTRAGWFSEAVFITELDSFSEVWQPHSDFISVPVPVPLQNNKGPLKMY